MVVRYLVKVLELDILAYCNFTHTPKNGVGGVMSSQVCQTFGAVVGDLYYLASRRRLLRAQGVTNSVALTATPPM